MQGHGVQGIGTESCSIKYCRFNRIEAGSPQGVTNEGEYDDEEKDKDGGDEERGPDEAIDSKSGRNDGSQSPQSGCAEDPHEGQDYVSNGYLYSPHRHVELTQLSYEALAVGRNGRFLSLSFSLLLGCGQSQIGVRKGVIETFTVL